MFNSHLIDEIYYLREQVEHERQRAERAIDELLRIRIQAGPVTMPTPREAEKQESLIDKLLRDTEFSSIGEVDVT